MERQLDSQAAPDAEQAEATSAPAGATDLGDTSPPWYGDIDDADFKNWVEAKGFKDSTSVLKSYRELEGLVGADTVKMPKDGEVKEWSGWDKLGVPKEAADYSKSIQVPELPEGMALDSELLNRAYEKGIESKIPPSQMQSMVDLFAETQVSQFEAARKADETDKADLEALYQSWGEQKDVNMEIARQGVKHFGYNGDDLVEMNAAMGSKKLIEGFYKMGKAMKEGGLISGGASFGLSPEQAAAELSKMKNDPLTQGILSDTSHPDYKATRERFMKLSAARG